MFVGKKKMFWNGIIILDDLPIGKIQRFLKWLNCHGQPTHVKNTKKILKMSHCNGRPAQVKKYEDFSKWSQGNGQPA
jgi:hypothetical protein